MSCLRISYSAAPQGEAPRTAQLGLSVTTVMRRFVRVLVAFAITMCMPMVQRAPVVTVRAAAMLLLITARLAVVMCVLLRMFLAIGGRWYNHRFAAVVVL